MLRLGEVWSNECENTDADGAVFQTLTGRWTMCVCVCVCVGREVLVYTGVSCVTSISQDSKINLACHPFDRRVKNLVFAPLANKTSFD